VTSPEGGDAASPAARFVQWRAVLTSAAGDDSPLLDSVMLYYRPKNVAPVVAEIEATPANYRFADKPQNPPARNLTLPPLGSSQRRVITLAAKQGHTLLPEQGYLGVRWDASDANDDRLTFQVEIRAEDESNWKALEEKTEDSHLSWDSTAFPDGLYRVRITASDASSNPLATAMTHSRISEPFRIDNSAPRINNLTANLTSGKLRVQFAAADTATAIKTAECSLDGGDWKPVLPTSRLFDSQDLSFDFELEAEGAGEHSIAVRVYDSHDNMATAKVLVR
jgi:hypothetical protein